MTEKREARLQQPPASKLEVVNPVVKLEPKEQAKLDSIAAEYVAVQKQLQQAQQALTELAAAVEQHKGRMQGALEAILDRHDLDPATHRWDFDGKRVTIKAVA